MRSVEGAEETFRISVAASRPSSLVAGDQRFKFHHMAVLIRSLGEPSVK